jgi:hypothetical protein
MYLGFQPHGLFDPLDPGLVTENFASIPDGGDAFRLQISSASAKIPRIEYH